MHSHDRIPREKMLDIVDDLVEMGVAAVTFSGGGEPLIYPHIVEAVDRLADGGIRIGALTNGSMLRGKVADAFIRNGTWLRVSIDGWDGPSYARSRNVDVDEFDKTIKNLTAFAAAKSNCALGASVIIDEGNASHLFNLCQQLKEAGVGHVKLGPCIVHNSGVENDAYHARFAPTVCAEIERIRKLEDRHFRISDHYHALGERFDRPEHLCAMAYLLTIIGADLTVYTCQDKAYTPDGKLGSIGERRFRDFWFSEENKRALAGIDPSVGCLHHCVGSAKNERLIEYLALDPDHVAFV